MEFGATGVDGNAMEWLNMRDRWAFLPAIKPDPKRRLREVKKPPPVHFLHIGKTGGSAFKFAMQAAQDLDARVSVHLHRHEVVLREVFKATQSRDARVLIHLYPHRIVLRDVPEGEKFMFFLRDPITRFVSGFYSRQRKGWPLRPSGFWTPEEKEAFERFATPNQLALALSSDDPEEAGLARAAMRNIRHVRDGYWTWFESEEYFRSRVQDLFFIGFQESLAGDFEILKSRLGLPRRSALPNDEVKAHVNPRGLDRTLQDEAVRNLRRWYEEDFRFVNLCREMLRENPSIRAKRRRLRVRFRRRG